MRTIKLKELCDLQNGFAFKSDDYIGNSNTLICRMSNIRPDGSFDILYNPKYLPDNYSFKYSEYLLNEGDLVIAMTDMANDPRILGVPTLVETKGYNVLLNQRVGKLINIDKKSVYLPYLKLALARKENKSYFKKFAGGGLQLNVGKHDILNIKIPFPSISDQLHIANTLSKAENLIARRKESIRLLDEFLKSTFLEMFGDPEHNYKKFPLTKLENLCTEIVDCQHTTPIKAESKTNYPCIRTSELKEGYINWESMQYLDEEEYLKRVQRLIPSQGDIVYGREGTYGEAIRIPSTHKFSLGQRTMLFRPDYSKCNSIFLWAIVRSDFVYRQAKKQNSGSTVGHVNVKDIKQFNILHPSLVLQTQFAQIVEKTESLKAQYQHSLQELEQLYGSLSQRAFRGELSAKDEGFRMVAEPDTDYLIKNK